MSKRLEANGLWESSRMIMPEHREAILQQNRDRNKKQKPVLDEQHIEELVQTISESIFTENPVRITLFGMYEDREIVGKVDKVATDTKQLKIELGDNYEWVKLEDVLEMKLT